MDIVWVIEEKCWAFVVKRTSSYFIVEYDNDGLYHQEILEPDDIMEAAEMGINYETDL